MIRIDENTSVEALLAEMPNLLSFSSNHNFHPVKVATTPPENVPEWHQLETLEHYMYSRISSLTITSFAIAKEVVKNPSSHSLSETTFFRLSGEGEVCGLNFRFDHLISEGKYLHCSGVTTQVTNKPMAHALTGFGNNNPVIVYQVS